MELPLNMQRDCVWVKPSLDVITASMCWRQVLPRVLAAHDQGDDMIHVGFLWVIDGCAADVAQVVVEE
jgi:hypothetical protein